MGQLTHSQALTRRVKKLQFSVLSPQEIHDISVLQKATVNQKVIPEGVTRFETYQNGQPVYGGVNDPRMGTFDARARCKTCDCTYTGSGSEKMNDCPGHFGHINLARPVFHIGFIDTVIKILGCVCFHCSRLKINANDYKMKRAMAIKNPKARLHFLYEVCRNRDRCIFGTGDLGMEGEFGEQSKAGEDRLPGGIGGAAVPSGCGAMQPKFSRKGLRVQIEHPDNMQEYPGTGDRKQELRAQTAHSVLKIISEEDMRVLGLDPKWSRPEWLIITVLPVPPPHIRPSVAMDGGLARSEDDLTHQLVNIVKVNNSLENCIRVGEPAHIVEQFEQLLSYRISAFFDNEQAGQPQETQKSGKPLKTLRSRLKGKEGRIRGNLMGKRVDFSARTVITADPNLGVDQIGVPRSIALNLTVPERVTAFNHDHLAELVGRGPVDHPGAKFIIRGDGVRVDLRYVRNKTDMSLEQGWIVERHLQDDDVIVFNRQPSLHKMSIMGHRVKVLDYSTFRMNLSVTSPYNADFDGDEMNLHVPQGLAAISEVRELMMVPRNIVSPQSNKPVMGIVQDSLLAVCKMTHRDVFVERDVVMNILMWVDGWDGRVPAPAILKPRALWTGKQLFTFICPNVNFRAVANGAPQGLDPMNASDTQVLVHEGELLMGIIDKKSVGSSAQGLIHTTWLERGPEECATFMNVIQKVVNNWLINTSFSIGVADTVADTETIKTIENIIDDAKAQVQSLVEQGQRGDLKTQPGKSMMESLEASINLVLNKCRDDSGTSAQKSLSERNAVKAMVNSGSKGSFINISQILACVGQQNVEGARMPYGFRRRTLPHFAKDDLGPESRGFVENSYLRGLSPQEFFFHAMGGREGLIDTAIKTAETGYIQRRLVKALEAVSAKYDGTLRDHNNLVIQFLYGEDGMDGVWVERQSFDLLTMGRREFNAEFVMDLDDDGFGKYPVQWLSADAIATAREDPGLPDILMSETSQLEDDADELRSIFAARGLEEAARPSAQLPVNIARLLWNAQKQFKVDTNGVTDLGPRYVIETVRSLCADLIVVHGDDRLSTEAQHNATLLFHILARSSLSSKRVLVRHRLDHSAFDWVIGEVRSRFLSAHVSAGEMCGVLAAQSIGEPITQMTLNTFHYAGVSAKNVTLGVPRVKEIINVAKSPRTPSLTIYLKESDQDQELAKKVVDQLEYLSLKDITMNTTIHFDPDPRDTIITEDKEFVEAYFELPEEDFFVERMSPWVLRFVLRKEVMFVKGLEIRDVARKINEEYGSALHIISSDDNAETLVLRIRVVDDSASIMTEGNNDPNNLLDEDGLVRSDDVAFFRRLEKNLLILQLGGIPNITKVYMQEGSRPVFDKERGWWRMTEWVLETDGTNLAAVLSCPDIDHRWTVSNDIVECLQVLGVEAARNAILREFRAVVERDGSYVNYRHIGTLADVMTLRGSLMAITRHGINRIGSGPMLRSSFEETVEILMEAATFAESDNLMGVTDNIMLGQLAHLGTGCMGLLMDEARLSDAIDYVPLDSAMAKFLWQANGGGNTLQTTPQYNASAFMPNFAAVQSPFSGGLFSPGASPFAGAMFSPMSPAGVQGSSNLFSPNYSYVFGYIIYAQSDCCSVTWLILIFLLAALFLSNLSHLNSPSSPAYSPNSPAYSPTSPAYRYISACVHNLSFFVSYLSAGLYCNRFFASQSDVPCIFSDKPSLQVPP